MGAIWTRDPHKGRPPREDRRGVGCYISKPGRAKGRQQTRKLRAQNGLSLTARRRDQPCWRLGLGLPASRTVRQRVPSVCHPLLGQPQDTNTGVSCHFTPTPPASSTSPLLSHDESVHRDGHVSLKGTNEHTFPSGLILRPLVSGPQIRQILPSILISFYILLYSAPPSVWAAHPPNLRGEGRAGGWVRSPMDNGLIDHANIMEPP